MFAKAADGRLQECIARVGRKDEGSLLLVALRCVLNGSNHEIMISVGKTSCSLPLQMRDVNVFLLKTCPAFFFCLYP